MFATDLREGSQRRVVIENGAPETVEAFLRLLYLDTLPPKTDQGALRVLADQYLVHGLVERCGKAQSLSPNDSGAVTAALITLYPLRDREGLAHFRGQDLALAEKGANGVSEAFLARLSGGGGGQEPTGD